MTSAQREHNQPKHVDDAELRIVQHTLEGDVILLEVSGELDIATAPTFRAELGALLDRGARRIVVDLSELSFIDSVALAVLVKAAQRIGDDGCLAFVVPSESYGMLIFEASGINSILDLFPTRDQALAHVRR